MLDYPPADPVRPKKSRHQLAGHGSLHGAESYNLLVERDALGLLEWLGQAPARELATDFLRDYAKEKGWTPGYLHGIVERAQCALREAAAETAAQARNRLVTTSEAIRQEAQRDGDYGPAVSALKLQADLLVPKVEQHQHLHAHFVAELPAQAKTIEEWESSG